MENPTPAAASALSSPPSAGVPISAPATTATPTAAPSTVPAVPPVTAPPSAISPPSSVPPADATLNLLATPAAPVLPSPAAPLDGAANPAPTPEQAAALAAITGAITPIDLGTLPDGTPVPWDTAAVDTVAAVFARRGIKPEDAKEIVSAYAAHAKTQIAAQNAAAQQAESRLNAAMVAECRASFGADLPRYLDHARKGGIDVFGAELFTQLASVPAFANDARILRALAARGRAVSNDSSPSGSEPAAQPVDLAQGLYGKELAQFK